MAENPYDPPRDNAPPQDCSDDEPKPSTDPFPHFVPIIQFSLRLLGIYLFVLGVAGLVEDANNIARFGQDGIPGILTEYQGHFLGSCIYFFSGLYFILGGRWVIERVFLPADHS